MKTGISPRGADRYVVGKVERFNQKYEMQKRAKWDPSVRELGQRFARANTLVLQEDKPGSTLKDQAFNHAVWALERNYARGVSGCGELFYTWDNKQPAVVREPEGLKLPNPEPAAMSKSMKKVARFLGASLVGICAIDMRWVYSEECKALALYHPSSTVETKPIIIPEEYQYAVVLAFEMDYELLKYSPNRIAELTVANGYSRMAYTTFSVANYIRALGYKAIPMGNDTACSIPLAIDAGLGELSRMGVLITPQLGPRVRLSKIFTDLPLSPDKPIEFGVWEFCRSCEKCARSCPGQAIRYGEPTTEINNMSNREGLLRWPMNGEKCFGFWAANQASCSNCIRVCPFNKPPGWTHDLVRWGVKNTPWMDPFFIRMDDWLGYGKKRKPDNFWEDKEAL